MLRLLPQNLRPTSPPCQTATYTVTVSPFNEFTGDVSLSCSGAPAQANCSVSPAMVTLDGTNDAMVTVNVTTTARSMLGPPPGPPSGLPWLPWVPALGLLAMLGLLATLKTRNLKGGFRATRPVASLMRMATTGLATMVLFAGLCASCGGGGGTPGTPAGTFPLTVTATSGDVSHTIDLTLTVN